MLVEKMKMMKMREVLWLDLIFFCESKEIFVNLWDYILYMARAKYVRLVTVL